MNKTVSGQSTKRRLAFSFYSRNPTTVCSGVLDMCGEEIENLPINAPLRKTKFTTLLTTKQRSGAYQVLIINVNFLLCVSV